MCDPTTATVIAGASLALAAGGTAMQVQGQSDARNAQQDAVAAEVTRQRDARQKQLASVDAAAKDISRDVADKAIDTGTAARQEQYAAATPAATGYLPGQSGGPQVVRDAVDRSRTTANNFVGQQGNALANLGGWSDALFGTRRTIKRAGESVGLEGSMAKGSAALLGGDLASAGYVGQGARTAGDIGVAAGQLGSSGAFNNLGSAFAKDGGPKAPVAPAPAAGAIY